MSQDVLTQLAEYGTDCKELQGSVSADDVLEGVVPLQMPSRPTPPRRGWLVAVVAAALILILVGGATWLSRSDDQPVPPAEPTVTTEPLVQVNPRVTDVIETGGWPWTPLVATQGAVWVADTNGGTVSRIDAATRQITDIIPVGEGPYELLPTVDAVWVATAGDGNVSRIDLASREVTDRIRVGGAYSTTAPLVADGALWVQSEGKGLVRVDLESRQVTDEYPMPEGYLGWWAQDFDGGIWSFAPNDITLLSRFDLTDRVFTDVIEVPFGTTEECCIAVEDAIWLVNHEGILDRFDLGALEVTDELDFGRGLTRGIAAAGAIWLPSGGVVYRIDPMLREVTDEITVGSEPWQPAFADGAIWVSNRGDGTVSRIDIETRQVTHTIQVGNGPLTPLAFDGAIWVPNLEDGTMTRIETR